MEHPIGLIGLSVALFASTNIDDMFVLLGFFADASVKVRHIVVGQYLGIVGLYGASVVASMISIVIPSAYIGLLGLVPIVIGVKRAWALRRGGNANEEDFGDPVAASAAHGNTVAVMAVTLANGSDNISIYTPLFATRSAYDIAIIGAAFAVMTFVWLQVAHWLTHHRTIGAPIRRYSHRVVPFVLIALGALILHEAGSFGLLKQ
ncbi:MAG: cadmium resistance transporter [Proteobacteria bacterium]|nr:cadmium resistance transporter [Pseudomonadota bacterium]